MNARPQCIEAEMLSLRGRIWRMPEPFPASELPGVDPIAAAIAARRGVKDLAAFFSPSLTASMPDPDTVAGMPKAVSRLCDAVIAGSHVGIVGDYDVDGATSIAILLRWLAALGIETSYYVPDRMREGYGVNISSVDALKAQGAATLLVVDSGTTQIEALAHASACGLRAIVIDHHDPAPHLPDAEIVNPKLDPSSPLTYLCSAGLTFLLLVGANRELERRGFFVGSEKPDLRSLLGLVALGTVADVVPMVGLNRAYVSLGLKRMNEIEGIRALAQVTGQTDYSVWSLGFVLGPCVNASGRIDDTTLGAQLLSDDDPASTLELAARLAAINKDRQEIQRRMVAECIAMAEHSTHRGVAVLHNPSWHPGVIGLAAAKVREALDLPSVVIGEGGRASCRSVEGYDFGAAVLAAREAGLLIAGGGHPMAAGFTVDPAKIDALKTFLAARADGLIRPPLQVDIALDPGDLTPDAIGNLDCLAPFGPGNPRPRICIHGGTITGVRLIKETHVKFLIKGQKGETEAIMFGGASNAIGRWLLSNEGKSADILGTAKIDVFRNVKRAVLNPEDLRPL